MSQLPPFRTGNVIRDNHKDLWIVVEVRDLGDRPTVEAVSFDFENVSATQRLDDHERTETCHCGDYDGLDPECEKCKGTGSYVRQIRGWKHCKVEAESVRSFIMKGFKKMMKL